MKQTFFETYVSNTPTGTSHNNLLLAEHPIRATYRTWFRVVEAGTHHWRFFFTNTVDSTMDDGALAYPDRLGGHWRILSASVTAASKAGEDGHSTGPVTFDGQPERAVAPGQEFWSDEVLLTLETDEVLLWEWTVEGNGIPYTADSMISAQRKTPDGWVPDDHCPKPDLLGCDRRVKKRIAFLGDSITEGCNTPIDACDHWVGRIAFHLGADYAVWNLGLGFARASDAAYHSAWMKKVLEYDAVNISFGVNDINSGACGRHYTGDSAEEIMTSLETLVAMLTAAQKQVILFSVPAFDFDQHPDRLAIWEEVNARIPDLAKRYNCSYFDFAAATDCPGHHGHGRYEPHPTGYGCWMIEQELWHELGAVYQKILP